MHQALGDADAVAKRGELLRAGGPGHAEDRLADVHAERDGGRQPVLGFPALADRRELRLDGLRRLERTVGELGARAGAESREQRSRCAR